MGVSLQLVNFMDVFRTVRNVPLIINHLTKDKKDAKDAFFEKKIFTTYAATDLLSNVPSCECGLVQGEQYVDKENPIYCPDCNTPVTAPFEQELQPLVWMQAPQGVRALINPIVWTMITDRFTRSGFSVVQWICDTSYAPQVKTPAVLNEVMAAGIERGYNNFYENFDRIINTLFNLKSFKLKKGAIDPLQILLKEQRDCVFTEFLPLPNRSLLVIEKTNGGTYIDPIIPNAVDAIQMMLNIDSPLTTHTVRVKENRTIKAITKLAEFYDDFYKTKLATKEGIFRKHVYGTRSYFSFRGVISSLTDEHDYDELHISWGIATSVLRIHVVNKLLRRGYTPNEAIAFLNEHSQKYHPLLDELFQLLIQESPYKGIAVIFQRNPSLERGSAQAMFVTKVKTDVDIPTISLSILAVKGFNADFDGDQLNCTLCIDRMTADQLRPLAPHMSAFDLNEPRKVSENLSMPKPVVATIANWVHSNHDEVVDLEKERMMEAIAEADSKETPPSPGFGAKLINAVKAFGKFLTS